MPHASDAAFVELETWLEVYGDRLLRSAYWLCGDKVEAQDLVQETLLQAAKSAHRFRGDSVVYTWLHGILLNVSRRHRRKQQRLVLDESIVLQAHARVDLSEDGDREVRAERLACAIRALSPEHREVIVLRYYENMKLQQIAVQTRASLGTVKSRLHYAVRCLEKALPDELNLPAPARAQTPSSP